MQFRFGLYLMASGLLVLLVVFSLVLFTLSNIVSNVAQLSNLGDEVNAAVQQAIMSAWIVFGIIFVAFSGLSIALGILISHRFAGPMIPIRRHIENLKKGNYKVQSNLREHDEFKEVMADLNDLAQVLEKRHGSVPETPENLAANS